MRVTYETMHVLLSRVLTEHGMEAARAELCAALFVNASRDGVASHGLNRFPRFIEYIRKGYVDIHARPVLKARLGMLEQWDGCRGPGNLNAHACMQRAIALARENTIGMAALSNTNHWMRPGNYGLMATDAGCIGILWTNTMPNMPPWGGREAKLGNNPMVFAVPHGDTPVLLDVAMSMFSYGKLESYARENRELPVDGGFDQAQRPTRNASDILETRQALPIGYWKGSGLSLALDLVAAALSGGYTVREVGSLPSETQLSQVFMAIDLKRLPDGEAYAAQVAATLRDMESATPVDAARPVHYPGHNMLRMRAENLRHGIPVDEEIWNAVLAL